MCVTTFAQTERLGVNSNMWLLEVLLSPELKVELRETVEFPVIYIR
jgi:hypothetical protein